MRIMKSRAQDKLLYSTYHVFLFPNRAYLKKSGKKEKEYPGATGAGAMRSRYRCRFKEREQGRLEPFERHQGRFRQPLFSDRVTWLRSNRARNTRFFHIRVRDKRWGNYATRGGSDRNKSPMPCLFIKPDPPFLVIPFGQCPFTYIPFNCKRK